MHKNQDMRALNAVSDYLYSMAQTVETSTERDSFSLALAVCGAIRHGSEHPFTEAVFSCFGCSLEKHIRRRDERTDFFAAEMRTVASNAAAAALEARLAAHAMAVADSTAAQSSRAGKAVRSEPPRHQPVGDRENSDNSKLAVVGGKRIQDPAEHNTEAG